MAVHLVGVKGALAGKEIPLGEVSVSVGRSPSSGLVLPDLLVSREHCAFQYQDGRHLLVDLGSTHGTFVNDRRTDRHVLRSGDQIGIGNSQLVFLLSDSDQSEDPASLLEWIDEEIAMEETRVLRPEDAVYVDPDRCPGPGQDPDRATRDLQVLLRIGTTVGAIRCVEALGHRLLELAMEVVPAERGAIVFVRGDPPKVSDQDAILAGLPYRAADRPLRVSRTVVNQVLVDRAGLRCNRIATSKAWTDAESLMMAKVESLLCVPLIVSDRILGVLYLDTGNPESPFDDQHLQLLSGIAAIAAIPLDNARRLETLETENQHLKADQAPTHSMIGDSGAMQDVVDQIRRVASVDSTVLILGESGTGKELAARAIHQTSTRANKPFLAVNCAALSEPLLESELFGHEKGAFTGAIQAKIGKMETADQGTLFLDEVGEMPASVQVKLLRVLQEREFERVGGTRTIQVDIRLIAATNRDLGQAIRDGAFREDLFYRLNVVSLTLPPLRDRGHDVLLLTEYFMGVFARRFKRPAEHLSPEARACLLSYAWPGNIRELENAIERAVVMGLDTVVRPEDLPEAVTEGTPAASDRVAMGLYQETLVATKRRMVRDALKRSGGRVAEAARYLGLNPKYLHRLIRTLCIESPPKGAP